MSHSSTQALNNSPHSDSLPNSQSSSQPPIIPRRLSGKSSAINPTSITMSPSRSKDERRIVSAPSSPTKASFFRLRSIAARNSNDSDSPPNSLDISSRFKENGFEQRRRQDEPHSPTSSTHSNEIFPNTHKRALSFSHLSSVFVKLRRAERRVQSHARSRSWVLASLSKPKSHHIESSSGPTPLTHPVLEPTSATSSVFSNGTATTTTTSTSASSPRSPDSAIQTANTDSPTGSDAASQTLSQRSTQTRKARLEVDDLFVCTDGVDVVKLLRASRTSLLQSAAMIKANALIDETYVFLITLKLLLLLISTLLFSTLR